MRKQNKGAVGDEISTKDVGTNMDSSMVASDDDELPMEDPVTFSSLEFLPEKSQLKPKLDKIFAEVENNLPTINFELSDLSSEEDVPIFNRAFKAQALLGPDSLHDSSDDEIEKQIYEESTHRMEQKETTVRKQLVVPSDLVISDSPKLASAADMMLRALGHDSSFPLTGSISSRMNSTAVENEDVLSAAASNKNKPLVESRTQESVGPCNRGQSDINIVETKESSAHSNRRYELRGNNRNARTRTTPLQMSSQKMVAMFFPDNSMQLDLELDNIDEMLSGNDQCSSSMSHGDNAAVHGYDVPSLATERNEESLMERLTKFAMSNSAPKNEDGNSSKDPNRESSVSSGKNVREEFASSGTSTCGYTSQKQSQERESIRKSAGKEEEDTIFIDLRTFDDQKRREQDNVERIQRVLGLSGAATSDSSDESEPELELWFEHRKRIKESLNLGKPISTEQVSKSSGAMSLPKSSDSSSPKTLPGKPPVIKSPVEKPLKSSPTVSSCTSANNSTDDRLVGPIGDAMSLASMEDPLTSVSKQNVLEAKRAEASTKSRTEGPMPKTPTVKADHASCQLKESDKESRLRLEQRLKALQPDMSCRGKQPAADATHPVFDTTASYEPEPKSLPSGWSNYPECTLLTIHLSCNGQIVCHDSLRSSVKKSIDQGSGMSASYNALVAWLLSLVPTNFDHIGESFSEDGDAPFCVVGLQQMALDGHLTLNAVVVPVKQFTNKDVAMKGKKCQQKDAYKDLSPFQRILKQFLVRNTLQSVCPFLQALESVEIHSSPNTEGKGVVYIPPLPQISNQPLSTFIQMNVALDAIHKVFLAPVGFFWQTVDNEEPCYSEEASSKDEAREPDDDEEMQSTICLVYKVYRDCFTMIGIVNRILQEGLCLCGLRLVYPTTELMKMVAPKPMENSPSDATLDAILALAVRGVQGRSVWLDTFGAADPALARIIDPNSLCARFGGESRDECLLFSPRTPHRIHSELARWFGGRVPPNGVVDLGEKDSGGSSFPRTKKGGSQLNEKILERTVVRPVATLTATTMSNIFLVISPLVPVSCLGLVLSLCQLRGYRLSGVRRLHLSGKQAANLAIGGADRLPSFTADLSRDDRHSKTASLPPRPSTIFLLKKENARNTAPSLVEAIMTHLTLKGILGNSGLYASAVQPLNSSDFFHMSSFSPAILQALKGDFTKLMENNLIVRPGCVPSSLYTNPELEQVVVVSVCGTKNCNKSGAFLAKLLGVQPWSKKQPSDIEQPEPFELLGLKWLPQLTVGLAKELTPYEVGDAGWKTSIQKLSSEPALLIALRGVNAFKRMESIICLPSNAYQFRSHQPQCNLDHIMSFTPEMAYRLITIFFSDNELFSDSTSRPILPFLPPHRTPGGIGADQPGERSKLAKPSRRVDPVEGLELRSESIVQSLLLEPQLLTAFLLVKADAVRRHTGSLLKRIYQENFSIVAMKLQMLSRESVEQMLGSCAEPSDVEYICGGPCLLLVLKRENAIKRLLDVVGSADPNETRRQGGYSWRTLLGTDQVANGLHCSCDFRKSIEDQKLFFPEGLCCQPTKILTEEQIICPAVDKISDVSHHKTRQLVSSAPMICSPGSLPHISGLTETTCVILMPVLLKPVSRSAKIPPFVEITDFLLQSEFELVGCRMVWLSQVQAEHLLKLLNTGSFDMVTQLLSGPCIVLALQRDVAVLTFRQFLDDDSRKSVLDFYAKDLLHAKDLLQAGELLTFFFDKLSPSSLAQVVPVIKESMEASA